MCVCVCVINAKICKISSFTSFVYVSYAIHKLNLIYLSAPFLFNVCIICIYFFPVIFFYLKSL